MVLNVPVLQVFKRPSAAAAALRTTLKLSYLVTDFFFFFTFCPGQESVANNP